MSNVAGKAYAMNVVTPSRPAVTWINRLLFMAARGLPSNLMGLLGLSLIHFARWVIVKRDQWPDLGQGKELDDIRERAMAVGAVRAHVVDVREEFAREYILPALQAGAMYEGKYPLATALVFHERRRPRRIQQPQAAARLRRIPFHWCHRPGRSCRSRSGSGLSWRHRSERTYRRPWHCR